MSTTFVEKSTKIRIMDDIKYMNAFWKNVFNHEIKQVDIVTATGKAKTTVNGWIKRDIFPPIDSAYEIAKYLNISLEELLTGDKPFDPALTYVKKSPTLRSLVIKLGLHPELVGPVDGYLSGYMESHGYNQELDKKEA